MPIPMPDATDPCWTDPQTPLRDRRVGAWRIDLGHGGWVRKGSARGLVRAAKHPCSPAGQSDVVHVFFNPKTPLSPPLALGRYRRARLSLSRLAYDAPHWQDLTAQEVFEEAFPERIARRSQVFRHQLYTTIAQFDPSLLVHQVLTLGYTGRLWQRVPQSFHVWGPDYQPLEHGVFFPPDLLQALDVCWKTHRPLFQEAPYGVVAFSDITLDPQSLHAALQYRSCKAPQPLTLAS